VKRVSNRLAIQLPPLMCVDITGVNGMKTVAGINDTNGQPAFPGGIVR
jgi:hypothetical protein